MPPPPPGVPFTKPWLSYDDQVAKLQGRGLVVSDPAAAAEFLSHVNYYRFDGYCLAFKNDDPKAFDAGTTFEQVRTAYEFDKVVRHLLSEAVETIEVDLRTAVAYHFGKAHGPFGHTDAKTFHVPGKPQTQGQGVFTHSDWNKRLQGEAKRSQEPFIGHFETKHSEFPNLPVWVATEVMSFGCLSFMVKGMTVTDQRAVASRYGVQPSVLVSWIHHPAARAQSALSNDVANSAARHATASRWSSESCVSPAAFLEWASGIGGSLWASGFESNEMPRHRNRRQSS